MNDKLRRVKEKDLRDIDRLEREAWDESKIGHPRKYCYQCQYYFRVSSHPKSHYCSKLIEWMKPEEILDSKYYCKVARTKRSCLEFIDRIGHKVRNKDW